MTNHNILRSIRFPAVCDRTNIPVRAFSLSIIYRKNVNHVISVLRSRPMNILIVDDEFYIVQSLVNNTNWQSLGITRTFSAYNVKEARRIIEENQIDILLTDIEMPEESGFDLIEWLHNETRDHPILPIILTAHQRFDYAMRAFRLHCIGYLLKPVEKLSFELEMKTMLENLSMYSRNSQDISTPTAHLPAYGTNPEEGGFVHRVQQLIYTNLSSTELNRTFIASRLNISPDYLSYLFHQKFGQTLNAYINFVRIDTAKELLLNSALSLQEISERSGFADCSYFHRQFKRQTGQTPLQFRANGG